MNIAETATVLAKIKLGDNREVDSKGLVLTYWYELIGHLNMDDCIRAVTMHRQESTEYLQPAHVIGNVKRLPERVNQPPAITSLFCPKHYGMPPRGCERCMEEQ